MGYSERLRCYRLHRKMSQEELAEETGLAVSAISKIEHGVRKVTLDEAVRFAEVLRVSLAALAGIEEKSLPDYETQMVASRCVQKSHAVMENLTSIVSDLQALASQACA